MAMTLFIVFVTYSALMILVIPLGWYGYLNGIDLWMPRSGLFGTHRLQRFGTRSSIMLAPVWMLGMSLMYVDERVRHEGYDIELMAPPGIAANATDKRIVTPELRDFRQSRAGGSRPPLGFSGSTLGIRVRFANAAYITSATLIVAN